jgi:hypothetical protein
MEINTICVNGHHATDRRNYTGQESQTEQIIMASIFKKLGPLALAPFGVLGGIAAGKLFGSRKPELSEEQKFASEQYKRLIAGGGYLPGERELQQQQLSRNIGAQSSLQKSLAAERLAATPGASDTAFGDAALSQYDLGAQRSLSDAFANMDIAAKQRVLGAIGGIGGMQPSQLSKGNAADILGDISGAAGNVLGFLTGMKSDKNLKKNIKGADTDKIAQLLNSLDMKKFQYKNPAAIGEEEGEQLGVIAQETPPPLSDGRMIDMNKLVMMLLAGYQSLSKELELAKKFGARKKEIESVSAVTPIGS